MSNKWRVWEITKTSLIQVLFLILSGNSRAQDTFCNDLDFYLHFPSKHSSHFSKVKVAGVETIEAFTICVWVKTRDSSGRLGLLRFSDLNDRISLAIQSATERLILTIGNEDRTLVSLPQRIFNNNWHGICVAWQSDHGLFKVYYDGRLLQEGNNFTTGFTFASNGTFTAGVGKDDNVLFSGRLGHMNAWPRVLEHPLLAVLSSKCGVERGDWVSWSLFKEHASESTVFTGDTCPFSVPDLLGDPLAHLRLDGKDDRNKLILNYSATFLEGRLDGHNSLYLDETRAYATAGNITLGSPFTIACWIKLLPSSAPYYRAIVQNSVQIPGFVYGVNSDNKLQLTHWVSTTKSQYVYSGGSVVERQWIHVAVSFVQNVGLSFYVNGFETSAMGPSSYPWVSCTGLLEIGRFYNHSDGKHWYFHGYLSDLFIFGKRLGNNDIGKLMGRSPPCTYTDWTRTPLSPQQTPTTKYREKTCPGVGQCTQKRSWLPGDCREVLFTGKRTSGVYTINPLDDVEIPVFCDHDTHGGGWTVIQRRGEIDSVDFAKSWSEYKPGFDNFSF